MIFKDIKKKLKNQNTIKIIISLLILIILFKFINFNLILNSFKSVNNLFLIVLILIPVNIFLRAWRFMVILNKDKKVISIKDSLYLNLAGIALNLFMPANSGDIAKSYYGYRWHGLKEEMLSSSIFDKFIALFSIFVIGSITAFLLNLYSLSLFSIILSLMLATTIFYPEIMPWSFLNKLISKFLSINLDKEKLAKSFSITYKIKLKTFIISLFAYFILYLQFYVLCLSFSINITFIYILAVAPLMNLAGLFPFTLNGLGSGEAVTIYLFSLINISPTMSLLVSLLSQVVNAIIPGIIGFLIIIKNK
jgi:glycosyltransferase 2 family protein